MAGVKKKKELKVKNKGERKTSKRGCTNLSRNNYKRGKNYFPCFLKKKNMGIFQRNSTAINGKVPATHKATSCTPKKTQKDMIVTVQRGNIKKDRKMEGREKKERMDERRG